MDYAGWITAVTAELEYDANLTDPTAAMPTDNETFNSIIPNAIDYTENRIQRDLDILGSVKTATGTMLANQRTVALPSINILTPGMLPDLVGTPIDPGSVLTTTINSPNINVYWPSNGKSVGDQVTIINPTTVGGLTLGGVFTIIAIVDADNFTIVGPSNATSSASAVVVGNGLFVVARQVRLIVGGRKQPPMQAVSRDFLDYAWPDDASLGSGALPQDWAPNDQTTIVVGPSPPADQSFEALGTMRIPQLSSTNTTNFLTQNFADLYLAASLIFFFSYQNDFGAQSDDPRTAQSWEQQYQLLLGSAKVEETRKVFANMFPSPSRPTALKTG